MAIHKKRHWSVDPKVTDQHRADAESRNDQRAKQ
jgi:hypothetical protein